MTKLVTLLLIAIPLVVFYFLVALESKDRTIDRLRSRLEAQETEVVERAKEYHGTNLAALGPDGVWRFIDKKGRPCKLFREGE